MILIEKTEVVGWEHAIRGMRNPMNSWDKSDSRNGCKPYHHSHPCFCDVEGDCPDWYECHGANAELIIGHRDMTLMKQLAKAGPEHRKFMRMIVVYCDITAPLYWWKEFDTYKVGTVANSCSTMHKIHDKEFTLEDFSHEHLIAAEPVYGTVLSPMQYMTGLIRALNGCRSMFLATKDKRWWWQMIQLLPTSYNQKRTVMMNYEVLANIYKPTSRQHHKQDEWNVDIPGSFCKWIESLPYSQLITGKEGEADAPIAL